VPVSLILDGLDGLVEEVVRRVVAEHLEEIEPTVYNVARAADYLGFSEGHIRRMVRDGKLPDAVITTAISCSLRRPT
jgi:hypothetical protein